MDTTLTSKGQMTIPLSARKLLGLKAGDKLSVLVQDGDTIVLKRQTGIGIAALQGLLPQPAKALSIEEMDAGVAAHLTDKHKPSKRRSRP